MNVLCTSRAGTWGVVGLLCLDIVGRFLNGKLESSSRSLCFYATFTLGDQHSGHGSAGSALGRKNNLYATLICQGNYSNTQDQGCAKTAIAKTCLWWSWISRTEPSVCSQSPLHVYDSILCFSWSQNCSEHARNTGAQFLMSWQFTAYWLCTWMPCRKFSGPRRVLLLFLYV